MSLSAIQDNLVKTSLVQHTQTRGDDIAKSQETAQAAAQRENNRQEDQVVIHTKETDQHGIRPDEEKEQQRRRKREEEEEQAEQRSEGEDGEDEPTGPRARMRRINIII